MPEALPSNAPESPTPPAVSTASLPSRQGKRWEVVRYFLALIVIAIIFFGEKSFLPSIVRTAPLSPLLATVLTTAYYAGAGPALAATVFGAVLLERFLSVSRGPGNGGVSIEPARIFFFLVLGILASWLSRQWHTRNASLRDREQKLRILLEKMPVVLWSTDTELHLTSSSAAMVFLFPESGLPGGAAPGIDPGLFHLLPADSPAVWAQRGAVAGESIRYEMKSGERLFQIQVEPLLAANGRITGSFGMAWDITAQHQAELLVRQANQELEARVASRTDELARANLVLIKQISARKAAEIQLDAQKEQSLAECAARAEAEASNKAKDHFLATLSHELRTPMTPVLMTVSAMENDASLSEEARAALRMIRRNVELEARLIDDLLDLTRISRGKLEMRSIRTDVHSLLCHARDVCLPDAIANHQAIELRMDAAKCFVRGDATRLQQVLWNLLRNAIKFTPEGGTIRLVSSNDSAGQLVVRVIDTGIGIEPSLLPRIFDAFEQGGAETTRRFGGLGLGLAISKAVIDLHGGTISAHSDGPGSGSTFTISLSTTDTPAPVLESGARPSAETPPLRILLVEDHADTRKATARLLRMLGHDVATADGVTMGLQAAENRRFDLVISDLGLPDGSGLDLMRQIKQRYGLKGIALSGFGMDGDLHASSDAGFDCHLVKPVPLEQLEAALRRVGGLEGAKDV